MAQLLDLLNVGPEETYLSPPDLQQVISWKKGYPESGGAFNFLNEDDGTVLKFIEGDGLYATPDAGTSGNLGRVLVDGYHSFVGMIVETDVNPATLKPTWAVCDGTLGTPDLRGKFVLGVLSGTYNPGTSGGAATINISHEHTIAHTHPHDHAAATMVAAAHTHGAGTYLTGDHQHSAGTYAGPSHTHAGPSHTHTVNDHSHGPGTLSLGHRHLHSHGLDAHDHDLGGLTTGTPSATSTRADGANPVGSATHTHTLSGQTGAGEVVGTPTAFSTTQSDNNDVTSTTTSSGATADKTGVVTNADGTGSTGAGGTGSVTGSSGLMTGTSAVTGTSGSSGPHTVTGSTDNDSEPSSATFSGTTGSATQSILPPYLALYFVRRIS